MRIFGRRLARENDFLKNQIAAKEKDIVSLRRSRQDFEDVCKSLEEEIDTLQAENKSILKENKNLKISQTNLKKKNAEYKENIKTYEASIEILNNTIGSIKTICKEAKGNTISKKKLLEELGE